MAERIIAEGIEVSLGGRLKSARPLGGGCIGEVYRVDLGDGTTLVAKVDREGESHLEREAYMLRYLREKSGLPVPEVYHGSERLLLMQFVEGSSSFTEGAESHAAELLAALHGITAGSYGHERDTLIGDLDQPNPQTENWTEFFREHRLLYVARVAHDAGRLPVAELRRVERLAGRLDDLIGEPNPPALIHGDVFLSRYAEIRGIDRAFFDTRRDLYNLYPLLVHTYYFGGGYLDSVQGILDRFGV